MADRLDNWKRGLIRILEEMLPFIVFMRRSGPKESEAKKLAASDIAAEHQKYTGLSATILRRRLKEEHERAKAIDDKTVKFTASLSIALTVLGTIGEYFSKAMPVGAVKLAVSLGADLSVIFAIIGAILALGALKTLPLYGYGTEFRLKVLDDDGARVTALAAQEKINFVRYMRNETAYECLRNGLIILLLSVILFTANSVVVSLSETVAVDNELHLNQCRSLKEMMLFNIKYNFVNQVDDADKSKAAFSPCQSVSNAENGKVNLKHK